MNDKEKFILDRMRRLIETSTDKHREMAQKYIQLAHARYALVIKKSKDLDWDVVNGYTSIERAWQKKFGMFIPYTRRPPIQ